MSDKVPNSRRNLDLAIERAFGDRESALRVRRTMANVILGQMLPEGVIKGGSALKIRYGMQVTRFSKDFDAARVSSINDFVDALEDSLAMGWAGFTGHVVPGRPAHPKGVPAQYVMQPFEIKLSYRGKPWVTVPLEVGHDEIGDADNPESGIADDVVGIFRTLNLPEPAPVPLMRLEYQVAQKLHALSSPHGERAHDLVDLQIILRNSEVDLARTRLVCRRLFAYRGQQVWPPTIVKGEGWEGLYDAARFGLNVEPNVEDAVAWANGLVRRIDASESAC